jgi:Secretion system C-terminal sorting domain
MHFTVIFLIFCSSVLLGQTFEYGFTSPSVDDVVADIHQLTDSTYIGIIPHANTSFGLADSLEIFSLDKFGNPLKRIIIKEVGVKFPRIIRSIQIPIGNQCKTVLYGSITLEDLTKQAFIYCIDKSLNRLWEYTGVIPGTSAYEGLADARWDGSKLVFYGLWTNIIDPAAYDARPFFLHLDENGNELAVQPIESMNGNFFGNDQFLVTPNNLFFFNARNTYYKCDLSTFRILDSFTIDLNTARIRGTCRLLNNNNIALLANSDSILSFTPPIYTGVPSILFLDSTGKYLSLARQIVHIAEEGKAYVNGMDKLNNGDLILPGFEGYGAGGAAKSDWLSLQRFSQEGKLIWERYFRLGKKFDVAKTRACFDGGFILSGYVYENDERDGQIYKFDSLGNLTGLVSETPVSQQTPDFVAAYPNPCNSDLNLVKSEPTTYKVEVFSNAGNLVKTAQFSQSKEVLDMSDLTVGMYQLVVSDQSGAPFQRLSVVKE